MAKLRVATLISGRGSNMQALIDACAAPSYPAEIVVIVSNVHGAPGLARAEAAGISTLVIEHKAFAERSGFEHAMDEALRTREVELICLAGFMRLLTDHFVERWRDRLINIHPSLLPAFPGVNAQEQALDHGVKVTGATVHLVTGELDGGPIVAQAAVPVRDNDTVELLSARILIEEHRLYPEAVRIVLNRRWRLDGRRFVRLPD
jgi:phosphoribosylglycinamide formyltransferase 1